MTDPTVATETLERLPVAAAVPALLAALAGDRPVVLEAPPGAGKSTAVPLALLAAGWLGDQRIVMLEPRRLAARAVATRMAWLRGEPVGETVGYRTRLDSRVGPRTRIEVVTEGILTRRLQQDPALEGVGCLIFDEFHERNLQADLGLALALDSRRHLRPDLRLLLMSATLDSATLAAWLDAAVVRAPGLSYPVETRYLERRSDERLERLVVTAVRSALAAETGDILVFLPGAGEIRRVEAALTDGERPRGLRVLPLFGDLSPAAQDAALAPARAGERKLVLATNIAETSLTIEGIRCVIDSGLVRRARFDPARGMSGLETQRIAQSSADQRRGRAGRLGPGVCLRLWTEAEHRTLQAQTTPEIAAADLAPLALELASWGTVATALSWLDPPPPAALAQGRDLLAALGALDPRGQITAHGRDMARLGTHPRLAHLLLRARDAGAVATGATLAALLGERDLLRGRERDADLRTRLELLAGASGDVDAGARQRVRRAADLLRRQLGVPGDASRIDSAAAGWLLACAYPDRIGRSREAGSGRYLLANGRGARFTEPQSLAASEFIVAAELDAREREARILLAAPLSQEELETHFHADITESASVGWDSREQAVLARRQRRLGALVLSDQPQRQPDAAAVAAALMTGIRELGLESLPWTPELRQWQARVQLLRREDPAADWPEVGDAALLATLEQWLAPWLTGLSRRDHLVGLPLGEALHALLDHRRQRQLAEQAPTHVVVPSGSRVALDYLDGAAPSLSVRLQEVFGLAETPRIAGGRLAVMMKLLSPARRPVQVTRDLASFWAHGYHEVRKELKGRYPRHYWPDDPHQAEATRRVRPRPR
jgi:ATP-dependent helicase HrpB